MFGVNLRACEDAAHASPVSVLSYRKVQCIAVELRVRLLTSDGEQDRAGQPQPAQTPCVRAPELSSCGAPCCAAAKKKKTERKKEPLLGATVEEINCTHLCHLRFKCFCNAARLNRYVRRGDEKGRARAGHAERWDSSHRRQNMDLLLEILVPQKCPHDGGKEHAFS